MHTHALQNAKGNLIFVEVSESKRFFENRGATLGAQILLFSVGGGFHNKPLNWHKLMKIMHHIGPRKVPVGKIVS